MKGKVTIELEQFVRSAQRAMEGLSRFETPPKDLVREAVEFIRGVLGMVPIDRGAHYRRTEAKVLREIAARTPEHMRKHFYMLADAYIEEISREVA